MAMKPQMQTVEEDAAPSRRTIWIVRGVLAGLAGIIVILVFFVILPKVRRERIEARFDAVESALAECDAERAIKLLQAIESKYAGADAGRKAAAQRAPLVPYVEEAAARKAQGDRLLKALDYEGAWRIYKEVAESWPKSRSGASAKAAVRPTAVVACEWHAKNAARAEQENRWSDAESLYQRILVIDPAYPGGSDGLARSGSKVKTFQAAMEAAAARVAQSDWQSARAYYERALGVIPSDRAAYQGRAQALRNLPAPDGMVLIVPGECALGTPDGEPEEQPPRIVRLDGFYMDVAEVTNAQYMSFVLETGHPPPPHWKGRTAPDAIRDLPVVCVSRENAASYARWAGKRLPTADEWERAARGTEGRLYPWGNRFDRTAGVFARGPRPAGSAPGDRSVEGCLDLAGNVAEWTSSDLPGGAVVCGASWAGLERDRFDGIVADAVAGVGGDPTATVFVGHRSAWGLTALGLSHLTVLLRGAANGLPVFEVRRYVPEFFCYASATFVVKSGDDIGAERDVRLDVEGQRHAMRVDFRTGLKVLEVANPQDAARVSVVVEDEAGRRQDLQRVRTDRLEHPDGLCRPEGAEQFKTILLDVQRRALQDVARCSRRWAVPAEARCINLGFRCVKDPDPARPVE